MRELAEGDPWPYTPQRLAKIAEHLGLSIDDNGTRFVVGIAREYLRSDGVGKARREQLRERELQKAECATRVRAILRELQNLYETKPSLRDVLVKAPHGIRLTAFIKDGSASILSAELEKFTRPPAARMGRTKDNRLTAALVQLISNWQTSTGKDRVSRAFLRDALDPLGCDLGDERLQERIAEARKFLGGPKRSKMHAGGKSAKKTSVSPVQRRRKSRQA